MMHLAKVVSVHPEAHKVDLLMLDDGRRIPGVKVLCSLASSSSGQAGLPVPDAQAEADPYAAPSRSERDLIACVAYYGVVPVVLGFLFPAVSEMLFPDADRYLNRTPSDTYWTVDGRGNAELYHPSGAYVRLGETIAHEDLTGKDHQGKFAVKRNTGRAIHIHIEQAGGLATIDIAPSGAIAVTTAATLDVTASGAVTVKAPTAKIDAPATTCTGTLTVTGKITGAGGLAISGGSGATVAGSMTITNGDVKADGIGLKSHVHTDPQGGSVSTASG